MPTLSAHSQGWSKTNFSVVYSEESAATTMERITTLSTIMSVPVDNEQILKLLELFFRWSGTPFPSNHLSIGVYGLTNFLNPSRTEVCGLL